MHLLIFWHWRLGRESISCGPKLPSWLAFLGECGVIPYWSQNVPHQPLGGAATDILFAQVRRRFLSTARKAQLRETVDEVQRGAWITVSVLHTGNPGHSDAVTWAENKTCRFQQWANFPIQLTFQHVADFIYLELVCHRSASPSASQVHEG